jgi:hypothetical protein
VTAHPPIRHLPEADRMRRTPGTWTRLEEAPTVKAAGNKAAQIRTGVAAAFRPSRHFEATSRGRTVWARWVGPEGPQAWPADSPPRQPRDIPATTERTPK